ncbi:MAG: DUF2304 domain-containing protein [Lachnospiraceae bacterium]|nr:DUF2304 domain-containing protein [Lachnospiraceae bacterium]
MSQTLQIALLGAILVYFVIVVVLLKKKRLQLKYTLLWLAMGVCFLVLALFPEVLFAIRDLLGFADAMNALFVLMIGFILILVMAATSIVSGQSERIKNLIQANALLEKRVRELEEKTEQSKES